MNKRPIPVIKSEGKFADDVYDIVLETMKYSLKLIKKKLNKDYSNKDYNQEIGCILLNMNILAMSIVLADTIEKEDHPEIIRSLLNSLLGNIDLRLESLQKDSHDKSDT